MSDSVISIALLHKECVSFNRYLDVFSIKCTQKTRNACLTLRVTLLNPTTSVQVCSERLKTFSLNIKRRSFFFFSQQKVTQFGLCLIYRTVSVSAKSLFKYAERIKRQVDTQVTLSIGSEGRGYFKAAFKVKTNEH